MNPLLDLYLDTQAIAEHQQRLRDSVAYRDSLADGQDPAPSSCPLSRGLRALSFLRPCHGS